MSTETEHVGVDAASVDVGDGVALSLDHVVKRFGDRDDDYDLPVLGARQPWPDFLAEDVYSTRKAAGGGLTKYAK